MHGRERISVPDSSISTRLGSLPCQSSTRSWNCEPPSVPFCTSTLGLAFPDMSIATSRDTV